MVLGASRIRLKFLRDIRVKILEPKNFDSNDAISRLFSQIIPEREQDIVRRKTKDIPLGGDIILCTLIHQQNVIDHSFDPLYINFSNDGISGAKGLFFLKILSLLEGDKTDDSLLTFPHLEHISPGNDAQMGGHQAAM